MTELLPCPWCGEQPKITCEVDYKKGKVIANSVIISCERRSHDAGTRDFKPLEESITAWNTRSDNWQPIETAPKDREILLHVPAYSTSPVTIGWYDKMLGDWYNDVWGIMAPDKWQPLPSGPKESK